jgi:hypothetical protein
MDFLPSPPWENEWTATGAFTSRCGLGEAVFHQQIEKQQPEIPKMNGIELRES